MGEPKGGRKKETAEGEGGTLLCGISAVASETEMLLSRVSAAHLVPAEAEMWGHW